jgi:16S rRNA C967 or C1407 C5-methylase (RsmB/RsmF family)
LAGPPPAPLPRVAPFLSFISQFYDVSRLSGPHRAALLCLDPALLVDQVPARLEPVAGSPRLHLVGEVLDPPALESLAAVDRLYLMTAASLLPALNLAAAGPTRVLDACAAPGGKALALHLLLPRAEVWANEVSKPRREHMRALFARVAPGVRVLGLDASDLRRLAFQPDGTLVDAPCSSDSHLPEHPEALAAWSEKRSRNLGSRQKALLMSAFSALAPGGRLVYSTCTASPWEDEVVVARFLDRVGSRARLRPADGFGLPVRRGVADDAFPGAAGVADRVLRTSPDDGLAPSFVAVIEKA